MKKTSRIILTVIGSVLIGVGAAGVVCAITMGARNSSEISANEGISSDVKFSIFEKKEEPPAEPSLKPFYELTEDEAPWLKPEIGKPVNYTREEALSVILDRAEIDERYTAILSVADDMSTGLLVDVVNNPEMTDFAAGYATDVPRERGSLTEDELKAKMPLFFQWDDRWGYESYGQSSIAVSGCGPTALAMVVTGITENDVTPADVADFAIGRGYYVENSGTSWSLMGKGATHYGLNSRNLNFKYLKESYVKKWLDEGAVLILSMKPGDFTIGGHFIVVWDYNDDGYVINDPFCKYKSSIPWEWATIAKQVKGAFLVTAQDTVLEEEPSLEAIPTETVSPSASASSGYDPWSFYRRYGVDYPVNTPSSPSE